VRSIMTLVHSALFAATLVGIAVLLTGCTVAQIQMPAQASAAFQQRQLSEASRNLDADTIALFSEHLTRGTRYVPTPCQPHRDPRGAAAR
jgi:hypothetical protein